MQYSCTESWKWIVICFDCGYLNGSGSGCLTELIGVETGGKSDRGEDKKMPSSLSIEASVKSVDTCMFSFHLCLKMKNI